MCVARVPVQILLLEAAERSPALENNLPITGTTATWYEELLPDAFPLLNPGTVLRKTVGSAGKPGLLVTTSPILQTPCLWGAKKESGSALPLGAAEERGWEGSALP